MSIRIEKYLDAAADIDISTQDRLIHNYKQLNERDKHGFRLALIVMGFELIEGGEKDDQ